MGKNPKVLPTLLIGEMLGCFLVGIQIKLYKLCNLDGDSLLKRMAEAVVLDPRYKMKYIVYWFNKWYAKSKAESMVEKVRGAIVRLYAHYATEFETASSSATVSASGSGNSVKSDVTSSFMLSTSDTHDLWKSTVEEFQHHLA
ncbi:zinc finger BED domain-containing protein RICESLEEPER 1-like [Fagus crenata]